MSQSSVISHEEMGLHEFSQYLEAEDTVSCSDPGFLDREFKFTKGDFT